MRLSFLLFILVATAPVAAEPPLFVVDALDGPLPAAPLEKLSADWSLQLGGSIRRALSGLEWFSLRREAVALPRFPEKSCVLLTSGDRLSVEPRAPFRVDDDQIMLRLAIGADVSVPRAYLAYFCAQVPDGVDNPALFLERVAKANRTRDVVYLKNGDRIEGVLATPARGPVYTMKLGDRTVATPIDQIAILALNAELQARPKTKKAFAHVITSRGARLQFSSLQLHPERGVLAGKTLFGARLEVPLDQIAVLTIRQGAATYLSDLPVKNYTYTPFFGVHWPLALDTDVMGRQIALGGNFYDKGLGMHAESQVSYALNGKYRWFEAQVGVEEGTGRVGRAKVSVLLDGVAALAGKELTGDGPSLPIRIDVRTARKLTLRVEFGARGDVRGRVNWADARLVGKGN